MIKKIEVWILYLVIFLGIPMTILFGSVIRYELKGGTKLGRVSKTALFVADIPFNIKKLLKNRHEIEVKDRFPDLEGFNGNPNSFESYLLLSRYNGDLNEGVVELIDLMNFNVLHTWNPDIDEFNRLIKKVDEFKYLNRDANNSRSLLVHPNLVKDGGLFFKMHKSPLRKIDSCSKLVFQNTHNLFSHSIETDIEGNIWAHSYIYPHSLPIEKVGRKPSNDGGYHDDAITKLSPGGEILFEKSVSQIFIDNELESLLFSTGEPKFTKDPIHLNDIQPVDFDGEFWKKGDVFLSIRNQSMIALYRPSINKIIWRINGPFFNQHDVDILDDHSITIFNNNMKAFPQGQVVDEHNEVIVYDFKSKKFSYHLKNSLVKNDVRTITQGRSQILPNGDLFLEETDYGRTLYFNSDGSLRWTNVNRANNGKVYLVAWSRIMYSDLDIQIVKNFLNSKGKCN